jgi:hypothetical protein
MAAEQILDPGQGPAGYSPILRLGHITRAQPPILAWRPRLLARNITGIG